MGREVTPARLSPDGRPPTISDVAREAGVTGAIVSRVLSGDARLRVRPETRDRVLRAAAKLDYVPNHTARALRLATSGALGLILHDVTNPLYNEILQGAQQAASAAGYVVLLGDANELAHNEAAFRRLLGSRRMDGVLFQAGGFENDAAIRRMSRARLPTVLINSERGAGSGSVVVDDVGAGVAAAEHLLALGHREIGFLGGLVTSQQDQRRREGVAATLLGAGLGLRREWIGEGGWDEPAGRRGMRALLDGSARRPSGIVVANVMAAIGALGEARRLGVAVPEQFSMVAIHDTWFAEHTSPPLTAVRLPLAALGRQGVEMLLRLIEGGEPQSIVITDPPRLVARASTAPPGS